MPGGVKVPPRLRADSPSAQTEFSPSLATQTPPACRPGRDRRQNRADRTIERRPTRPSSPSSHRPATGRRRSWRSGSSARDPEWRGCRATRPTTTPPRCGPPSPRQSTRSRHSARPRRSFSRRSGGSIGIVPAFVAAIEPIGAPMTIVLDHLEHVSSRESHAALAEFAMRVPRGWQLALASREPLPIPTARLRAQGRITELGPSELAMSATRPRRCLPALASKPRAPEPANCSIEPRLAGRAVSRRARHAGGHADRGPRLRRRRSVGRRLPSLRTALARSLPTRRASCCAPRCSTGSADRCAMQWPA